jgi:hypothetical protein
MRKTQRGYGVCIPDNKLPPMHMGPLDNDGFWLTNTHSGVRHLLISIRDIFERLANELSISGIDPARSEITGFHCKFNPQGDALMLSLRWFTAKENASWDMFEKNYLAVQFAWITLQIDPSTGEANFSTLRCATGPTQWRNPGHHATWFPDGRLISQNLAINGADDGLRFVQVAPNGTGLKIIPGTNHLVGSGHPTIYPDNRHLLTDAYPNEPVAYGDGTVPLRWVDLHSGKEIHLVRINASNPATTLHSSLRCDPHPAWDHTFRYIVFNGMDGNTRRVYLANLTDILEA